MKIMREPVFDKQLKAIANAQRLLILDWLKNPTRHFRPQVDGDLVEDGVCALLIGEKLGLAQPTTAQHLKLLVDAGLLAPKRIKKWTFYRRDEARIEALKAEVTAQV
jgi:ArsR family transcriptional regulator